MPRTPGGGEPAVAAIERYLETTGFSFEVLTPEGETYGASLRKGVSDTCGEIVVVIDGTLPYPVSAIGDAVAWIDSSASEVVFALDASGHEEFGFAKWLLHAELPEPGVLLMAFTSTAAKVAVGESRIAGAGCDLEIAYLVNKYGFRVERLRVVPSRPRHGRIGAFGAAVAAIATRIANRRNAYRSARRCPVCFSSEVHSCAQIPGNVVRSCSRCKCRYLNQLPDEEGGRFVRRMPHGHTHPSPSYELHSSNARDRTSMRRFHWIHRQVTPRARVLEIGVRDGSFGILAAREYEYVGIDPASAAARHARARGLEIYCATLPTFVNTGPSFDAITLFHVFENMADPHDALGRIKDLLKPGGLLLLSTFDTEGLLYLLSERKRMTQNFRTHLILYSRSALIELLEHSGFEILSIGPDYEYRDHKFLRHWLAAHHPRIASLALALLRVLPDPLLVSTGSIRMVAKRRSGSPQRPKAIRTVEPTHAR